MFRQIKINDDMYDLTPSCVADEQFTKDFTRAENIQRELWRFSINSGGAGINKTNIMQKKYYIYYNNLAKELFVSYKAIAITNVVYFLSYQAAIRAIDKFHDDLIWLYTKFKPFANE